MRILNPAIKSYIKLRWGVIDNFLLHPHEAQTMMFNSLISSAQFTQFGKQYDFDKINQLKDFKQAVPIHTYEDMYPYIERMLHGEQNISWRSDINWFAQSSGTTSEKSKFIPVSTESLEEGQYKAGKDVLALYYRNFPQSKLMSGKVLVMGGSHQVNKLNADSFYGDLSAVVLQNLSYWHQLTRTPDLSIALLDDWEEKIERMANATADEDVSYIAGVPTWTSVLLNRIKEIKQTDDILNVWPNLELYIHGGVNFDPYKEQFKDFFPSRPIHYQETYNASEGFFAAQDIVGRDGMLLLLSHGIFYEFMPMEELGKDKPETLSLSEVEMGVNYALVVSTNAGLWRYMIGDTIAFTSLNPYRIKVTGRTKHFINAFGEEVIIENADQAISEASKYTNTNVSDYTAAPIYFSGKENGAHQWLIECEIAEDKKQNFIEILDKTLQNVNSDYEAKRQKDIALRMPEVTFLPKGSFTEWLKSKNKLGGQNKVPRLSNDRKLIEEIIQFLSLK